MWPMLMVVMGTRDLVDLTPVTAEDLGPLTVDGPRLAICVGIKDYPGEASDLPRPVLDAELVCNALKTLGFDAVKVIRNPQNLEEVKEALAEFDTEIARLKASGKDIGKGATFLYYAGHAFVDDGDEQLAFGSAKRAGAGEVGVSSLSSLLEEVMRETRRTRLVVAVSDACRNLVKGDTLATKNRSSVAATSGGTQSGGPDVGKIVVYTIQEGHPVKDDGLWASTFGNSVKDAFESGGVSMLAALQTTNTRVARARGTAGPELRDNAAALTWELSPSKSPRQDEFRLPPPPITVDKKCPTPRPSSEGVKGMHWVCVPPGDPAALARTWRDLLADPARRAELGRRGREAATTRFPARVMAAGFRELVARLPHPS